MNKAVRSRILIMERLTEVKTLGNMDWDEIIPDEIDSSFYDSFLNQLFFLKDLQVLRIRDLAYVLRISTKTYYKIIRSISNQNANQDIELNEDDEEYEYNNYEQEYDYDEQENQNVDNNDNDNDQNNHNKLTFKDEAGRPPLVTKSDEDALLIQLELQQRQGDCFSPKQARKWLQDYLKENGKDVTIDRFWWYRFKEKNKGIFNVYKIKSLESERTNISKDEVNSHFDRLHEKLKHSQAAQLIINMDESGFIKRPNKNSTKNCICMKNCEVSPSFRDEMDGNHISVVAGVTLAGTSLKPLLISTTEKPPKEVYNSPIGGSFLWFKTKKGYLNEQAMEFWVLNILLPYINYAKQFFPSENTKPLLICDGLKSHQTDRINDLFRKNSIEVLILPPHSSHILQCLDLCFFAVMKKHYRNCRSYLFDKNEKKSRKIEKIIKSYHAASFPTIILAGWKASGIESVFKDGQLNQIYLNRNRVIAKLINA